MKNYPTKLGKLYLTTYVLKSYFYLYTLMTPKIKNIGARTAFFSQNISVKHSLNNAHSIETFALSSSKIY